MIVGAAGCFLWKKMNLHCCGIMLPVELLHLIARESPASYRAMLALPAFARSLDPGTITDYMILFGHSVAISRYSISWTRNGLLHRLDGPAHETIDGVRIWCQYDKFHREGGPAVEHADGRLRWYKRGKLHRVGGPAVYDPDDGSAEWYLEGSRHREDGPAVIAADGSTEWYYEGCRHREDGPAYEGANGTTK